MTESGLAGVARRVAPPHALGAPLCGGLAAANAVRVVSVWLVVCSLAIALAAALVPERLRLGVAAVALAGVGLWWGSVRLADLGESLLVSHVGRVAPATVVVTGPVRHSPYALRAPARIERLGRLAPDERVLLVLPPGRAPPQGGRLELAVELRRPRGPEDGFDEREWLRRQGVHVVARGVTGWRLVGRRDGVPGFADRLRAALAANVAPGLDGPRRGVVEGVVLGADEALTQDLRDAFRTSGLYHLLAVSGQNVAFLAGGMLALAWLLGVPRGLAEVGVLLAIVAYVLAVGWQPSVVRAGVAGALASLAWLTARPRDRWHFLLLGAIVLLAWNPYSLLEPGFQLSFTAVAAIFVVVPRLERLLEGYPVPRGLAGVVAVSGACGAATAPVVWLHFGAVPIFSVVSNALAAPVVAPLLGLGLASSVIAPIAPAAAASLAWVNGWIAAYLIWCAEAVAALPHAQISSGRAAAALTFAAVAVVALARFRARRRLLAVAAVAAAFVAGGWRLLPEPAAPPPPRGLRITFLDVGQGDAVLVQTRAGALLVDQGAPEADVAGQLRRLGVRRLALLVLTHPQRDHVGGAAVVLDRIPVDRVLDPRLPVESPEQAAAVAEARSEGVPIDVARAGRAYALGRLRVRVLWPDGPGTPGEDPNRRAVVLLISYGAVDALLTADAESEVTAPLDPPDAEILKVAHHGSADPLLPRLLELVRPRIAVISVGSDNDYGHPAPSTVAALAASPGLDVYRTDRDGRVVIESDGRRILATREG